MCWASSLAIGFPIMFGLNQRPDGEDPGLVEEVNFCGFYNPEFIIYSSLGSFYIPCLVMVVLYSSIFKVVTPKVKSVKAKKGKKKKKDNQRKERKATQTLAIVLGKKKTKINTNTKTNTNPNTKTNEKANKKTNTKT